MKPIRAIARWGILSALGLLGVITALSLLLPQVINTGWVKNQVRARIDQTTQGRFEFSEIQIDLLPRPHAILLESRLDLPEALTATAGSIAVYPRLLPLMTGRLSIEATAVQSLEIRLQLPGPSSVTNQNLIHGVTDLLKKRTAAAVAVITRLMPDGRLKIHNGRLTAWREGRCLVECDLSDLIIRAQSDRLSVDAQGRSNLVARFALQAGISLPSLDGQGRITLAGVSTQAIQTLFLKTAKLPETELDLTLGVNTQALETWQMSIESQNPTLILTNDTKQTAVQKLVFNGTLDLTPTRQEITIARLELQSPRVSLTGSILRSVDQKGGPPVFQTTLLGQVLDLTAIRQAALDLIESAPLFLRIVQGGNLSEAKLSATHTAWSDLAKKGHLKIDGRVDHGRLLIPGVALDLTEVSGLVSFADGTLTARQAAARYGGSTARKGQLDLGLTVKPMTMSLVMELDADLAQLPPILQKVIPDQQVRAELNRISSLSGKASGQLALVGPLDHRLDVQVKAGDFTLKADYDRLPYTLELTGEQLTIAAKQIIFNNIDARLKNSQFSGLSGELTWPQAPQIAIRGGASKVSCEELYGWMTSTLGIKQSAAAIDSLSGWIDLTRTDLSGPLTKPRQWRFAIAGTVYNLIIASGRTPEPILIANGRFSADPHRIAMVETQMHMLDGTVEGSAAVNDYSADQPRFELTELKGVLGGHAVQWFNRQLKIPQQWRTQTPIRIETAQAHWSRPDGLTVNTQIAWQAQRLHLTGKLGGSRQDPRLDLRIMAKTLDVQAIMTAFDHQSSPAAEPLQKTRVNGQVTIQIDRLIYAHHLVEPFRASLVMANDNTVIDIIQADLCGISTKGQAHWTSRGLELELWPSARNQGLSYTGGCLAGVRSTERFEGALDIDGRLETYGRTSAELVTHLTGQLQVKVINGRIYNVGRVGLFTNLLSFMQINNLLSLSAPDFGEMDFPYKSVEAQLGFKGETIEIKEANLYADALNMVGEGSADLRSGRLNLTVLISPLTTVDTIVRNLPIVGNILQGTLLAVPVGVSGHMSNPTIVPLSPKAIGSRVLGILARTLKTPFRLVQPLLPSSPEVQPKTTQPPSESIRPQEEAPLKAPTQAPSDQSR